jgi:hypothetical protein
LRHLDQALPNDTLDLILNELAGDLGSAAAMNAYVENSIKTFS